MTPTISRREDGHFLAPLGALALLFQSFTAIVILLAVPRPGKVTRVKLAGAICVDLMPG